jgi:protein-disulfide isomerase
MRRRRFAADVVRDVRDGRRFGARWTPTFFIEGVLFEPSADPGAFARAVASRVAQAQAASAAPAHP